MFRKTKIRLVSLYSLVFFFILIALSMSLYIYMYHITFLSIDNKLTQKAQLLTEKNGKVVPDDSDQDNTERRVVYLFFGNEDKLIVSYPQQVFFHEDLEHSEPKEHKNEFHNVSIKGHSYRILTIEPHEMSVNGKHIQFIQLVYNIDPETDLMKDMLYIIVFGTGIGLILSVITGFYFANRALIPIQESWEKQSQFVADASHELRTPLAVIQTHLELLFRHPAKTIEDESETIYKSLSEVKRVNKLVEDLLTLARSDSNDQQINPNIFSLDKLLQLIVEQFGPIAELKDVHLEEKIETNLLFYGDKERLHQLFVILLDNAIKFTPPNGKVFILAKKEGNYLKIIISDTGIGISEKDLPHIFDRFYRSDKSRSRAEGGTGLGLSIAKWIVEAHSGQISAESQRTTGTHFMIKFPRKDSNFK